MRLTLAACSLAFVAAVQTSSVAAVYYVSPSGNDSLDGQSQGAAWKTVSKVNGSSFQPGDQILFQRGGQWRESLNVPSNGTAGAPITFADYGSGAKPKFWGSMILANANFQSAGNGVYLYPTSETVYAVLANQTFFYFPNGQSADNFPNAWSQSGGSIHINSPGSDPRTDGKVYSAVQRDDVVFSNYKSHLIFKNLVVDESARYDNNGGYGFRIMGSQNVQVIDCEAYHAGKHHFGVINATGFIGTRLYAAYTAPGMASGGGASAFVSYGDNSTNLSNQTSEWHDCTADHQENPQDGGSYYAFFTHGANMGSVLLDNMISIGGNLSANNSENTSAVIRIKGGSIQNGRLELEGSGLVVDGMDISGPKASVDISGSNITVQNMLIRGTHLGSEWFQTAIVSRGSNNTIRFNTIIMDPAAGSNSAIAMATANKGLRMYGNIISAPERAFALWVSNGLNSATIAQAQNNLYTAGATFAEVSETPSWHWVDHPFSEWRAMGFDAGSISGAPGFVNAAAGDYHLTPASPAVDAAPLDPSLETSMPKDFDGADRLQGSAFDMGAFESGSTATPAPPVITSAATLDCVVSQPCSYQISATRSPTGYNATGLPGGLSINTVSGAISGSPSAAGTSTVGLSAANASGTGNKTLTLTVTQVQTPPPPPPPPPPPTGGNLVLTFDQQGLATLTYAGVGLVSASDRFTVGDYVMNGTRSWGGVGFTSSWDNGSKTLTYSYPWGRVLCQYIQTGDRLDLKITVQNTSGSAIEGIQINPTAVQFPGMPTGWDPHLPQVKFNINGPSVIGADYGSGFMGVANMDVTQPMYTGFTSQGSSKFPMIFASLPWSNAPSAWPVFKRDIPAGSSETRTLSLRFGPSGSTVVSLFGDVYDAFAAAFPNQTNWTDHRSIAALIIATANTGWQKNPRGWFLDSTVDVTTPAGISAFHQRLLSWADSSITVMRSMGSQGMVTWDIEGEQYPHAYTYVGDPRQAESLAPEVVGVIDQYFKKFTDAGFRVGVTIRPQRFSVDGSGQPHQDEVADPAQNLIDKVTYAKNRWGATLFYVDSNGDPNSPYDAAVFKRVLEAVPGILLMPEHKDIKYFAYSAPYHELRGGINDLTAETVRTYPNASGVITVQDGPLNAAHDKYAEPQRTQLVTGVRRDNILMYRGWFDDQPFNNEVKAIYAEAGSTVPPASACDVNGDGSTSIVDVQLAVNQVTGVVPTCTSDVDQDGRCSIIDVQRIVNAVLGGACRITP